MILQQIQTSLNAPKGQTNKFGGYKYRSCEDILTALKPHLKEHDCAIQLSDDIVDIGGRIYVKATVKLFSNDGLIAETSAFAREPLTKKGADESQITGAASSYSRKYALSGMFAIDDSKDADSNERAKELKEPRVPHDKHLQKQLEVMSGAENIDRLKLLARSATDYFSDWGQQNHMASIKNHYTVVAANFENQSEPES